MHNIHIYSLACRISNIRAEASHEQYNIYIYSLACRISNIRAKALHVQYSYLFIVVPDIKYKG